MLMLSVTFPCCLGPTIHLCRKPDTRGNKKHFKKTPKSTLRWIGYPARVAFKGKRSPLRWPSFFFSFFLGWMHVSDPL